MGKKILHILPKSNVICIKIQHTRFHPYFPVGRELKIPECNVLHVWKKLKTFLKFVRIAYDILVKSLFTTDVSSIYALIFENTLNLIINYAALLVTTILSNNFPNTLICVFGR